MVLARPLSLPFLCLALAFQSAFGFADLGKQYGGYVHSRMKMEIPFAYEMDPVNGTYQFEAGWIEPLGSTTGETEHPYLNPVLALDASPYNSNYFALFRVKPVPYLLVGAGYKRLLYHGTLVPFDTLPPEPDWRLTEILAMVPEHSQPAGGDIFIFQADLLLPSSFITLQASAAAELWDVDAKGKSHIYEYQNSILLAADDVLHQWDISLMLFPNSLVSPTLKDEYTGAVHSKVKKNKVSAGITGYPLNRKHGVAMDIFAGYWIQHPHVDGGVQALTLTGNLVWNVKLITK